MVNKFFMYRIKREHNDINYNNIFSAIIKRIRTYALVHNTPCAHTH